MSFGNDMCSVQLHDGSSLHSNDEKCVEKLGTELKKMRITEQKNTILAEWSGRVAQWLARGILTTETGVRFPVYPMI